MKAEIRNDWTLDEVKEIYSSPVLELIIRGAAMHKKYQATGEVQVCTLLSVKTGGCPEDCSYCPQAARYHTGVDAHKLMGYECMSVQLVSVVFMKSQNNKFTKENNQIWFFSWAITGHFSFICVFSNTQDKFYNK